MIVTCLKCGFQFPVLGMRLVDHTTSKSIEMFQFKRWTPLKCSKCGEFEPAMFIKEDV